MFAGSIVLSITLLAFAGWLQWNEHHGWDDDEPRLTDLDRHYFQRRGRSRRRTNGILALCGVLILVAAFAGPGLIWMAAWMCVTVALATVVGLAGLDALRTHRYQNAKLDELVRRRDEWKETR
jgi:Flp pilus assembly protein TadB